MKEMAPIRLDQLEVIRVEEMIWTVSPRLLCPGIPNAAFEPYRDWLVPHFSTTRYWWRTSQLVAQVYRLGIALHL